MTVRELIAKLEALDKDLTVYSVDGEFGEYMIVDVEDAPQDDNEELPHRVTIS